MISGLALAHQIRQSISRPAAKFRIASLKQVSPRRNFDRFLPRRKTPPSMVPLQSLKDLFSSCQGHSLSQACLDGYPKGGTKLYPASLGRRSTRPCALDLWVAGPQNLCLPYLSCMRHSAFGDGIADRSSTRTPVPGHRSSKLRVVERPTMPPPTGAKSYPFTALLSRSRHGVC